jgi:hypothetical protein
MIALERIALALATRDPRSNPYADSNGPGVYAMNATINDAPKDGGDHE